MTHWFRYFFLGGGEGGFFVSFFVKMTNVWKVEALSSEPAAVQPQTQLSPMFRNVGAFQVRFLLSSEDPSRTEMRVCACREGERRQRSEWYTAAICVPANEINLFFRMKFENLHYRNCGWSFSLYNCFFYQSLNFHLAISYHLKRQHLLTFGYPFGYTKEKSYGYFFLELPAVPYPY